MIYLENITEDEITKTVIFYNKFLERQKGIMKRYYDKNRERMNETSKNNYKMKYSKDPEYLARRSIYFKERYLKKKQAKAQAEQIQ
jgi:hypothetical protein